MVFRFPPRTLGSSRVHAAFRGHPDRVSALAALLAPFQGLDDPPLGACEEALVELGQRWGAPVTDHPWATLWAVTLAARVDDRDDSLGEVCDGVAHQLVYSSGGIALGGFRKHALRWSTVLHGRPERGELLAALAQLEVDPALDGPLTQWVEDRVLHRLDLARAGDEARDAAFAVEALQAELDVVWSETVDRARRLATRIAEDPRAGWIQLVDT